MSQLEKKKKGIIVMGLAIVSVLAIVYFAVSYQTEHNHRTAGKKPQQSNEFNVVEEIESQGTPNAMTASNKNGPSLSADAKLPSDIPPAMLKAMQERGMTVDDLRGSGKGSSTTNGSNAMANGEFPDAMQKALAERNAQKSKTTPATSNMGMQAGGAKQFPAYIYQGVKHIENHKNKDQIALINGYMDILATDPNNVGALVSAADAFAQHNDIQSATFLLQRATTSEPSNAHVAYLYGAVLNKNFDSEATAQQWERSLSLEENPRVRYELALLYRYQLNQADLAKQYLKKALTAENIDSALKGNIQRELKR